METQALHVTETKTLSSSLMSNTEKCIDNDEITPEMEDQLLSDNFSEDQVLEDEDDAQSEGSIRLRYSDVEADDDENADKSSGASESALNNPLKKIHDDMANESSVVRDDNLIPIYTNGINDDLDKIDFTEDDTLLGINFCNNDDNENDLLSVKEIIDKTITLNQFSQSAYDNSWRLGGKSSRYRHKNYHNFLRISNFKQLQNNSYIPDTLNLNYYNIRKTCERLKNSTNENVNSNDKKVYLNKKNTSLLPPSSSSSSSPPKFMTKIFPPISKIQTNDNVIIKSKNDMIDEKLDNPKNNISNVDIIEKNNKMTDKNFDQGTDESTDSLQFELPKKQVNGILDNINIDKSQLVNNKNTTTATTTTTEVTVSSSDDIEKNPNKNVEIITNGVESTEVVENIDTKNDNTEIEATKTDESSDSGFVSTSASVTENDEILKDTNEELIKDKIVINEQPPILTPEIEIEQENNVNEIMEINNSEIIVTEINKNEECIHVLEREEPTLNESTNDLEKTEETIITDDSKLVESMDIVTIDEVTVGSNVEKIDKIEEKSNDVDVKTTSSDNEKVDMIVDDQESIGTSNNEISVINQEQQVDSPDGSSKQQCNKRKRKSIKTIGDSLDPEKENLRLRVKRETAQKAEELIRKDSQMANDDSDSDSYDIKIKPTTSPNSLKRTNEMTDLIDNKRLKIDNKIEPKIEIKTETYLTNRKIKPFTNLRKILLRDCKQKLTNMRQEDLEELLIQKIIETITMRDEIGKLREQAKLSERAKELSQQKCASLAKQIKDFEMIINRYASDREKNPDIYLAPTKINRSVGLQVNFLTDRGVQNLRQVNNKISQQNTTTINKNNNINNHANNNNNNMNNINNNNNRLINNSSTQVIVSGVSMSGGNMSTTVTSMQIDDSNVQLRKGIKIRSPRRGGDVHPQVIANIQNQLPNQMNIINSITSPIVVPKVNDTRITIAPTNSPTAQSNNNNNNNTSIIVNGNSPNIQYRQTRNTTINNQNNNNNNINNRTSINGENLIDLTEEEEKTKILSGPPALTALVAPVTTSTTLPKNQQRQTRMIPSNSSAHVTISQPNIRVVTGQQGQPTGIVNNVNGQRVIFMHPGGSPSRQLILTSAASTSRTSVVTAASSSRNSFINIAPSGITTVPKTTPVRVMPGANPPVQLVKVNHPAPLPATPTHTHNPLWKMSPPAPSLKISKVTHGIVLSWNMILSDKCADIASYQLFAYQEISTTPPSSSLWKKVGDVRALPLPMACTLTQFLEGNNYYFAVRAVDCHGRLGEFSLPGNITL